MALTDCPCGLTNNVKIDFVTNTIEILLDWQTILNKGGVPSSTTLKG